MVQDEGIHQRSSFKIGSSSASASSAMPCALRSGPALQALSNPKDTCAVCIDNLLTFIDMTKAHLSQGGCALESPHPALSCPMHGSTALYVSWSGWPSPRVGFGTSCPELQVNWAGQDGHARSQQEEQQQHDTSAVAQHQRDRRTSPPHHHGGCQEGQGVLWLPMIKRQPIR